MLFGKIPTEARIAIIHIGTNNSSPRESPQKVAKGILMICKLMSKLRKDLNIIATGLLPGKGRKYAAVKTVN